MLRERLVRHRLLDGAQPGHMDIVRKAALTHRRPGTRAHLEPRLSVAAVTSLCPAAERSAAARRSSDIKPD